MAVARLLRSGRREEDRQDGRDNVRNADEKPAKDGEDNENYRTPVELVGPPGFEPGTKGL